MLAVLICSGVSGISHWLRLDETSDIVQIREEHSDEVVIPLFGLWASRKGKATDNVANLRGEGTFGPTGCGED
jgi:hypothetical protein